MRVDAQWRRSKPPQVSTLSIRARVWYRVGTSRAKTALTSSGKSLFAIGSRLWTHLGQGKCLRGDGDGEGEKRLISAQG